MPLNAEPIMPPLVSHLSHAAKINNIHIYFWRKM